METFNLNGRNALLEDAQLTLRNHEIFEEMPPQGEQVSPQIIDNFNITNMFSQESQRVDWEEESSHRTRTQANNFKR
jgi:hypothetical protein